MPTFFRSVAVIVERNRSIFARLILLHNATVGGMAHTKKAADSATAKAIEQTVEKAEGFTTLGLNLDAWETLEDLPSEAKHHPRVLELRLEILCHEKEWQKAEILGESIIAALPRSALARYYLAVARCQSGDMAGAKEALKSAIELDETLRARALDEPGLLAVW